MFEFWINFSRLTRPLSNVKNIAIISLAFYLSQTPLNWSLFVLGSLSLSLIFSAIYAYNSACDADVDKYNNNKRHYLSAVAYFSKKKTLAIVGILFLFGVILAVFINVRFFYTAIALAVSGFFYSSRYFRFKEKPVLDVVFGATLTILLRFVAAWFIFSMSFPPLLPMFALVFLKNGGYMLYKCYDRPFLIRAGIKNSITLLKQKTILVLSLVFFVCSIGLFILMCLNSLYLKAVVLGALPVSFLFLLIFFIPPIVIQYLLVLEIVKINPRYFRTAGFISMFIIIAFVFLISK